MSSKLRILHLTHEMAIGGTQEVVLQLVGNLNSQRYECHIACIDGEVGALGERMQADGTVIHLFDRKGGFDKDLIRSIRLCLNKERFDIIHCHQYTPFVYGVLAAAFTGTKVVFTEHGRFYPDTYSWKRRLVNPMLGYLTHSMVAISAATRRALVHYEWFSEKHIDVVYNGLEPQKSLTPIDECREKYSIPKGATVFGTVARFDPIKNIPLMINAFKNVYQDNPNTCLLLVGDGVERATLEALVYEAGIGEAVIFTGFQLDTASLMQTIDIYLLTSFSEGTSMTLLEAMSLGICSIVTRVGGNVELIEHRKNGVVIDSQDVAALTLWMSSLLNDTAMRNVLGNEAQRAFNKQFSIGTMVAGYTKIYEAVCD